ncbi:MAG: flagellar biosynthetic protein FliQ [Bryobacteraceae bacterium]
MTSDTAVEIIRQALMTTFWLSAPLLLLGLVAGIAISLLQIVTSIQDTAVGTVPRLIAFLAGIIIFLPWMVTRLLTYTTQLFSDFSRFAR